MTHKAQILAMAEIEAKIGNYFTAQAGDGFFYEGQPGYNLCQKATACFERAAALRAIAAGEDE